MFRKLALLPSSGKKRRRGGTYSEGPLERNSLNHWTSDLKTEAEETSETLFFKEKIFDYG
jgi:hypothetical protein